MAKYFGQLLCDRTIGYFSSVNTTIVVGFHFVLLFSLAVTFLHSYGGNFSITAARNTWVGYSICLCVMEVKSCTTRLDGGGSNYIEESLRNERRKET